MCVARGSDAVSVISKGLIRQHGVVWKEEIILILGELITVQISEVPLFITLVYLLYFKAPVQPVVLNWSHFISAATYQKTLFLYLNWKKKNGKEFKVWVVFCCCFCFRSWIMQVNHVWIISWMSSKFTLCQRIWNHSVKLSQMLVDMSPWRKKTSAKRSVFFVFFNDWTCAVTTEPFCPFASDWMGCTVSYLCALTLTAAHRQLKTNLALWNETSC